MKGFLDIISKVLSCIGTGLAGGLLLGGAVAVGGLAFGMGGAAALATGLSYFPLGLFAGITFAGWGFINGFKSDEKSKKTGNVEGGYEPTSTHKQENDPGLKATPKEEAKVADGNKPEDPKKAEVVIGEDSTKPETTEGQEDEDTEEPETTEGQEKEDSIVFEDVEKKLYRKGKGNNWSGTKQKPQNNKANRYRKQMRRLHRP